MLTNGHVVEGAATAMTVRFGDSDVDANVVGRDPSSDLALLKVNPGPEAEALAARATEDVKVGDPTVAIGNPFGLDRTVTTGIVSALQRDPGAQRLRDRRRHPDRRRDQPGQLRRARCSTRPAA